MNTTTFPNRILTLGDAFNLIQNYSLPKNDETKQAAFRRLTEWYDDFPVPNCKGSMRNLAKGLADPEHADDLFETIKMQVVEDCNKLFFSPFLSQRIVQKLISRIAFWSRYLRENAEDGKFQSGMELFPEEFMYKPSPFEP